MADQIPPFLCDGLCEKVYPSLFYVTELKSLDEIFPDPMIVLSDVCRWNKDHVSRHIRLAVINIQARLGEESTQPQPTKEAVET